MTYVSRPWANDDDDALLRDVLRACWALAGAPAYCTVGDLDWWRAGTDDPDVMQRVRLWFAAGGQVAGFSWLDPGDIGLFSHPAHRAVESPMLVWAEGAARAAGDLRLTAWAFDGDAARRQLLRERDYRRDEASYVHFYRELGDDLPTPALPPGYTLRHLRGAADLGQRVAVHRDAFAPSRMTVAKHRAVMASPTYRRDLDLVVVAPDGSFAAFGIVWLDAANRHGVFEPVGCAVAHRRRGLAAAIVREGQRRLRAHGATAATVLSAADNHAARRLYASVGFHELDENHAWIRQF